jgi:DNA-binding response OmpR family regulator
LIVAEDDDVLRALVETSLRKKGYQVLVAASYEQAESLAQFHDGPIHLLLTDLIMPGKNGRELAARIHALRPQARVLWMSGYSDDKITDHGALENGLHFLQKPFTPSALAEKVREVLDQA